MFVFCLIFCFLLSFQVSATDFISDDIFQKKTQQISREKESGWLSDYSKFLKSEEKLYQTKYPVYPESKVANFLFGWMPEYQELRAAKAEMERKSEFGFYNYSHRLAMCRIGQMGGVGSFFSPTIGLIFSFVKELDDMYQKSFVGNIPLTTTMAQSLVDMENSYEAVWYGFYHPHQNCREWLKHLDYKMNSWQKEKVESDIQYITPNEKVIQ